MFKLKYTVKNININNKNNIMTYGILSIYAKSISNDISFFCNSGKFGGGTISLGIYRVLEPIILKDEEGNKAYKKDGVPWYCELKPLFNCDRTGLYIHPDGGVDGTLGCLGIENGDMELLKLISEVFKKGEKLYLEVM